VGLTDWLQALRPAIIAIEYWRKRLLVSIIFLF